MPNEIVIADLVVKARGDIVEAEDAIDRLDDDLDGVRSSTGRVVNIVSTAAAAAGGAILAVGGAGAAAAIGWESAFADVRKTVDGTPEELSDLETALRGMASDSVLSSLEDSHTQLAGIAALAGQLGIETPNIAEFTRIMGMMALATNVTSEDAAVFAARFANITGMDMSNLEGFADTIVTLGNNMAAQETDIVAFANNLASLANFDFTPAEILAYSAAMASLGLSSELGSTNMLKTVQDITAAVSAGGPKLATFADTAGMTADEFAELNRNDPSAAFDAFIEGLSNMSADEQLQTLAALNITGSEQIRVLTTMAAGYGTVAEASTIATEAYQGNNALVDEANAKSETAAGGIAELGNKLHDMAITVGNIVMPLLRPLLDLLGNILDGVADFVSGLDVEAGLGAFADSIRMAGDILQILMDRMQRGIQRFGLNVRKDVADFVSGLRETVLNATGGQLDIAPDVNFEIGDVQQAIADMDFADAMRDAINTSLQGEDFDITSVLFGPEGFQRTLTPTDIQSMVDFGAVEEGFGFEARRAVERGLRAALEEGDTANAELLEPLAMALNIDTEAMRTDVETQMIDAMNEMSVEDAEVDTTVEPLIDEIDLQGRVAETVGSITFAADATLNLSLTPNVTVTGGPDLGAAATGAIQGPVSGPHHDGGVVDFGGASEGWAWLAAGETVRTQAQEAALQRQASQNATQNAINILINSYGQSMRDLATELRQESAAMGYMN